MFALFTASIILYCINLVWGSEWFSALATCLEDDVTAPQSINLPLLDSLLQDGEDLMDIPWNTNPQYNVVEVIWKNRQRPQQYIAQLHETVEDSTEIVYQEQLANQILQQAAVPATKVQKKTDDNGFHQNGEWYVNTDDKLSSQGMLTDNVIIDGRTFHLKLIRRTALQKINNTDGLSTLKTAKEIYCHEIQTKLSYRDTLLLARENKRKPETHRGYGPTTPTGTKLRAIPNWGPEVSQMPHYADQEAAQALLTMQE